MEIDVSRNVMRGVARSYDIYEGEASDTHNLIRATGEFTDFISRLPYNVMESGNKIAIAVNSYMMENNISECAMTISDNNISENLKAHAQNLWKWMLEVWNKMRNASKAIWNKYTGKDADSLRRRIAVVKSDLEKISKMSKINKDKTVDVDDLKFDDIANFALESMSCSKYMNFDIKSKSNGGEYSLTKMIDYIRSKLGVLNKMSTENVKDVSESELKSISDKVLTYSMAYNDLIGQESKLAKVRIYKAVLKNELSKILDVARLENTADVPKLLFEKKERKTLKGTQILSVKSEYLKAIQLVEKVFNHMDTNLKLIDSTYSNVAKITDSFDSTSKEVNKEGEKPEIDTDIVDKTNKALNDVLNINRDIASTIYDSSAVANSIIERLLSAIEVYTKKVA